MAPKTFQEPFFCNLWVTLWLHVAQLLHMTVQFLGGWELCLSFASSSSRSISSQRHIENDLMNLGSLLFQTIQTWNHWTYRVEKSVCNSSPFTKHELYMLKSWTWNLIDWIWWMPEAYLLRIGLRSNDHFIWLLSCIELANIGFDRRWLTTVTP